MKDTPIVLVAFGTTTRALETYAFMDSVFKERLKSRDILWAYSSRMVRDFVKKRKGIDLKPPLEVLNHLASQGHEWAVVQSLHLISGHEFYRMVEEVSLMTLRVSIGLPLLTSPRDYQDVACAFKSWTTGSRETANVFVGHGTDHPSWASYPALENIFRKLTGGNIFVGVVDGSPSAGEVVEAVCQGGFSKVRLIPLMLVAGTHFFEDLAGAENSWKQAFERRGLEVTMVAEGIGYNPEIVEIFCRHIEEATEAIGY